MNIYVNFITSIATVHSSELSIKNVFFFVAYFHWQIIFRIINFNTFKTGENRIKITIEGVKSNHHDWYYELSKSCQVFKNVIFGVFILRKSQSLIALRSRFIFLLLFLKSDFSHSK